MISVTTTSVPATRKYRCHLDRKFMGPEGATWTLAHVMDGLTQPGILEYTVVELHYLWPYLHTEEPVCLPGVVLRCNKTALIVSNDKAGTPVPDAIIKSGLINQTAVWQGMCVWWQERWVMRGWRGGRGWDEGMMGGLSGFGREGRKRRGVHGGNDVAHLVDLLRDDLIGGVAESRRTTPSVSLRCLINPLHPSIHRSSFNVVPLFLISHHL